MGHCSKSLCPQGDDILEEETDTKNYFNYFIVNDALYMNVMNLSLTIKVKVI